jgi:hypothetical protein
MTKAVCERMWFEFTAPGNPKSVLIEHAGIAESEAAAFLIGQGALPHRKCSCCDGVTPINGVKVRLVREFGGYVTHDEAGQEQWVPATTLPGEWRTYPLSKRGVGN